MSLKLKFKNQIVYLKNKTIERAVAYLTTTFYVHVFFKVQRQPRHIFFSPLYEKQNFKAIWIQCESSCVVLNIHKFFFLIKKK